MQRFITKNTFKLNANFPNTVQNLGVKTNRSLHVRILATIDEPNIKSFHMKHFPLSLASANTVKKYHIWGLFSHLDKAGSLKMPNCAFLT